MCIDPAATGLAIQYNSSQAGKFDDDSKPKTKTRMTHKRQSIGRDAALALYDKQWWIGKSHRELAEFQMLTDELSMPFEVFHEALEKALGRPVFTHELACNADGIAAELFDGKPAPTFQAILDLIPEEKRIVIVA